MQRRTRPVLWPAKLLWAPLLAAGLPLMMHVGFDAQGLVGRSWRVVVTVPAPGQWAQHPATFWPGLLLLLLGIVAVALYNRQAQPGAWTVLEAPWFAAAAWILLAVALLAAWRLEGHVAGVGAAGLDWRFLAHARTPWLDQLTVFVSLAAGAGCWVASWRLRAAPLEARHDAQPGRPQHGPAQPR